MTVPTRAAPPVGTRFVVQAAGGVDGDDGAGGDLAAALQYGTRLAGQVGGLLGLDALRTLVSVGPTRVDVDVLGQALHVVASPGRPDVAVSPGRGSDAAAGVRKVLAAVPGLDAWAVLGPGGRTLLGELPDVRDSDVGRRCEALLRSLGPRLDPRLLVLGFGARDVVTASVGPHLLVATSSPVVDPAVVLDAVAALDGLVGGVDADDLVAAVADRYPAAPEPEVRTAPLSSSTEVLDAGPAADEAGAGDDQAWWPGADEDAPAPVGARFPRPREDGSTGRSGRHRWRR